MCPYRDQATAGADCSYQREHGIDPIGYNREGSMRVMRF
jgi:hypothetical protein